jgi:trehalose 6-phosphate synthase
LASIPNDLPLVAFANRLPVVKAREGWRAADGGLVTALRPALQKRGGAWVGWDAGKSDTPRSLRQLDIRLYPVELSRKIVDGYYHGFCNRTIWPLFHDLIEQPAFDRGWWNAYVEANTRFAHAGMVKSRNLQESLRWVHDFHLMLLPEMLRNTSGSGPIAYFLHTPFPAPELFSRLPWCRELLQGILGSDVVGFHTDLYKENFLRSCSVILEDVKVDGSLVRLPEGRNVLATTHPISIDASAFAKGAIEPEVEREVVRLRKQFQDRKVLLGVDRLDYTKGIRHRLKAVELLFERNPALRREISLVQIAVPSRDDVKEYRDLRADVEVQVGRINGRFTEPGHPVPVHYLYRSVPMRRLMAYYRLADVGLVTPLKDGMNLVAKEFVVCQAAGGGSAVLLLSEFTGAAQELKQAILCNPFDVEGLSFQIEACLEMEEQERRDRLNTMASAVHNHDVFSWVDEMVSDMEHVLA